MKIILCVTGSIAATEDLKLVHQLRRHGFEVECFMTESAAEIITPMSMEFATENPVVTKITGKVEHVRNAQADLILVAPATANTISKFAHKIADTSVTTLLLTASGYKTPILFVPSMHISMYRAIENNINKIKKDHPEVCFMEPNEAERKAKFPSKHEIVLEVERMLSDHKLQGMNVLVGTGGTFEAMDAMRGITNRSSGKMGVEIAKEAYRQGANVTLLCGLTHTHIPKNLKRINVESTSEMMSVVKNEILETDIYVSAAAISDFEIDHVEESKYPSENDITVKFTKLPKILQQIKEISPSTFVVGFKAEAGVSEEELIKKATNRMNKYNTDIMVANDILVEDGGPGSNNNEVYLIDKDSYEKIELDSKWHIAQKIIDKVYNSL
ncbi:bifunctional phosphopantothenoylcysteine decarboxylase/phosphopantothenate--cysteine ligase CoaBC [Methanosphaera sp. WGK6]|uniref:bifunctional phosphopantothenoylcysteine decarboxylase/phosphopantothenate--cysteine ligase CoaBC n=1 Tax=Methanosphaera sp. WGK6 TaxID=1561964 RepID=UPI00084C2018|nr:bifunctional phosphopantothenoylcysteine decarboxylase/phosphopantothenate--cysteine ligase CoaBC [Methanosphaera sp. WGK6]OED30013.1 bifunctional phosphopantothenoylcysteine decarboxylase/phosphopantothenate synthase [Methanosphaera sp. WGK6]